MRKVGVAYLVCDHVTPAAPIVCGGYEAAARWQQDIATGVGVAVGVMVGPP
jgi:hypothetical protein